MANRLLLSHQARRKTADREQKEQHNESEIWNERKYHCDFVLVAPRRRSPKRDHFARSYHDFAGEALIRETSVGALA